MEPSRGLDAATLSQLHSSLSAKPISRELHAFCRLCPPSAGARLLAMTSAQLSQLSEQCHVAVDAWLGRDRTFEVMQDVPSLTTRDSSLPPKAKLRDGSCLITGEGLKGSEVAHIIPYSVGKSRARASTDLWAVLRIFWGDDRANRLQNLVFGEPGIDTNSRTLVNALYNVITMSSQAHSYWGQGFFAFEPHPDDDPEDQRTQHAIFRWVYPHLSSRLSPGVLAPIHLTADIPALSTDMAGDGGRVGLFSYHLGRLVQDGDVLTFHTDDLAQRPLPSRELLWLQYSMIRVLRMAGRAGWDMLEMNYSDSDIDSVQAEDEHRVSQMDPDSATVPTSTGNRPASSYSNHQNRGNSARDPALPTSSPLVLADPTPTDTAQNQTHFFHRLISRFKGWTPSKAKDLRPGSTRPNRRLQTGDPRRDH